MLVAAFLLDCGLLVSSDSLSRHAQSMHTYSQAQCADRQRRRALLVDEFLPIDVTQALEEGQRAKCVGVSNLHIARHSLDQSHEVLQLRCYVIWGQGMSIYTEFKTGNSTATMAPRLALNANIPMSSTMCVSFIICGD